MRHAATGGGRGGRWLALAAGGLGLALLALLPWLGWLEREPSPSRPGSAATPDARPIKDPDPPAATTPVPEPERRPPDAAAVATVLARIAGGPGGPAPRSSREALALARDPEAPLASRIAAVRWLGSRHGGESLPALEEILADAELPSLLRGTAAEALGSSSHPDATVHVRELLDADDPDVAVGAIRGLAASGSSEALGLLADVLDDPARAGEVRAEAAHALGGLDDPRAAALLLEQLAGSPDESLAAALLSGLATQPTPHNERFFREFLQAPGVPLELRVAAVRALAARADAEALAALLRIARDEPHPAVRADLYAALAVAPEVAGARVDARALVDAVAADPSSRVRVEGSRLVARLLASDGDLSVEQAFDDLLLPWLESQAVQRPPSRDRLIAIEVLGSAGTEQALAALHRLARSDDPLLASAAERALIHARAAGSRSP